MQSVTAIEVLVIGGGPAGQKAAIQAVKAGKKVALVEQERAVGGGCVSRGTIPSKSLREAALRAIEVEKSGTLFNSEKRTGVELADLMSSVESIVDAHAAYMGRQLERNGVRLVHGRARFVSPHEVVVRSPSGSAQRFNAELIVIATGSRPRSPPELPVDHDHVLDSDSILSMHALPESLCVLGGGVIACEYASIFANLGVKVTLIDKAERPLAFMDSELVRKLTGALERCGGRVIGGQPVPKVEFDGVSHVVAKLANGEEIRAERMLVALGRVANLEGLDLPAAGLAPTPRGLIAADANGQTAVPHIYAVGDVIGPPSLAASAMEQGRRAMCHALGLPHPEAHNQIPIGIYTIPELSSVGMSVEQATEKHGAIVGRARFDEVARGQIANAQDGLLKLVADGQGKKLLGVHIVGAGATELIHLGQVALAAQWDIDQFVEHVFNFPTLAEAYRVAALDIVETRAQLAREQKKSA